jgi:hypothetical protein
MKIRQLIAILDRRQDAVLENIPEVMKRTKKAGLDHRLIDRLAKKLTDRVAACRKLIR